MHNERELFLNKSYSPFIILKSSIVKICTFKMYNIWLFSLYFIIFGVFFNKENDLNVENACASPVFIPSQDSCMKINDY